MMRHLQKFVLAAVLAPVCMCNPGCVSETPQTDEVAAPSIDAQPHSKGVGFTAILTGSQLRTAYAIGSNHGSSTLKVGVVIAGGYNLTRAAADVSAFRTANSLHTGQSLAGYNQTGGTTIPAKLSDAWEQAGAAGLQIALAMADDVTPILVCAQDATWTNLKVAVAQAKTKGATRIVLPFTFASDQGDGTTFASGAMYFAGTDVGANLTFPAMSDKVVSVSPTILQPDGSGRGFGETVGSGAVGCSTRAKPAFQADSICPSNRTVPDLAAIGDSSTPVEVYYTSDSASQVVIDISGPGVGAALAGGWFSLDGTKTLSGEYSTPNVFDLGNAGFDSTFGLGTPNGAP